MNGKILFCACLALGGVLWVIAHGDEKKNLASMELDPIKAIAVSSDGKTLALGGPVGGLMLFDYKTGRLLSELQGKHDTARALAFSPDGTLLAVSDYWFDDLNQAKFGVSLWNTGTGKARLLDGASTTVTCVAFQPQGNDLVAAGDQDGFVTIWDLKAGKKTSIELGTQEPVRALSWSSDSRYLAVVSKEFFVIDRETSKFLVRRALDEVVLAAAFGNKDREVLLGLSNRRLVAYDLEKKEFTARLNMKSQNSADKMCFSSDLKYVAFLNKLKMEVWSIPEKERKQLFEKRGMWIQTMCFSPDSKFALIGGLDFKRMLNDESVGVYHALKIE